MPNIGHLTDDDFLCATMEDMFRSMRKRKISPTQEKMLQKKLLAMLAKERPKYVRMASKTLGGEQSGEDAVQEATLLALRNLDKFDSVREMSPWFSKILRNECLMTLRSRARKPEIVDSEAVPDGRPLWDAYHEEPDNKGMYSFVDIGGHTIDIPVSQLLAGLTHEDVEVFLAVFVDGMSRSEACREMCISPSGINDIYAKVKSHAASLLSNMKKSTLWDEEILNASRNSNSLSN